MLGRHWRSGKARVAPERRTLVFSAPSHAMSGKQGLAEWTRLQKQERELAAEISDLDAEKIRIKSQIKRLQADRLDLDFVEELSREKLAFARQDELIVYRESIE